MAMKINGLRLFTKQSAGIFILTLGLCAQALAQTPAAPAAAAPTPAPTTAKPDAKTDAAGPAAAPTQEALKASASDNDSAVKTIELAARPVVVLHDSATWEEGYKKLAEAQAKLREAAAKAGLKVAGRPMSVFTDTDDAGFKFDAMLPIESAPGGKSELTPDIKVGASPAGKALKFEHRGAYDDIDTTYEAITAYLDERGYAAKNLFIEEYVNDPKDASDNSAQIDIFVFVP